MKWETVKLGDIATCIQPGPFGSQLHNSDYSETGTPIIMPKDMINGHISHTNLIHVGDEHISRLSRHQVHKGNIMVARKGDVRKCVFITEKEDGWMTGSDCLKVALNEEVCFPKFIYYQLRSPFIGKWLETISIGATMPSLNTGLLSGIEVFLPPITVQKTISDILSAYDDLIESNQKQIKLLEEAAQRLYKEWFIDLRFPGHESTPIRNGIPEGWQRTTVEKAAAVLRRGISPSYDENGDSTVINQKCIRQTIVDLGEARKQTKKYPGELNLQNGDTVICSTGDGTLGRVGQVFGELENTTLDSHVTLVRAASNIGVQLLFWTIKSQQAFLQGMGKGSTNQLELNRNVIQELPFILPDSKTRMAFETIAQAIHDKITTHNKQIIALQTGRDRLLPKLMSGEIEV